MNREPDLNDLALDRDNLYREDLITDRRAGTIRRLTPVMPDGSDDPARSTLFHGQTQLLTPAGVLPVSFDIEADSLAQAIDKFAEAAKQGIDDTIREIEEMRKEASSSIYVPQGGGGPGGPGGFGGDGMPGGGFQLP